ncbi:MAG TPA: hypothetical protein PLM79_16865, partial [Syntrophobacteraceae bacterium]|nr:hypothetical protein [Syntrophobacteraceae bacterium]
KAAEKPYEIHEYNIETLKKILAEEAGAEPAIIEAKAHCAYFEEYFEKIGAKTIIVEKDYVDHYFLDDFTGHYVCCFKPYSRCCTRLHFFKIELTLEEFEEILKNPTEKVSPQRMREIYLGFVVVKPLPQTIIGRTCLKTFDSDGGRRHYPITRNYRACLFGWNLEVDSLAFQEQDKVVAACSTSALWAVLQGTGKIFHHHIPSPVEITKRATDLLPPMPPETRHFPSHGLSVSQMAQAIKQLDLMPHFINPEDEQLLRGNAYSYLMGRIPILMTFALVDYIDGKPKLRHGLHAVAITGYSLGNPEPVALKASGKPSGLLTVASRINKLYVHDDQVGPFVRMEFPGAGNDRPLPSELERQNLLYTLSTSWPLQNGSEEVRAVPLSLMVPLFPKIRIPYSTILDVIIELDFVIETFRANAKTSFEDRLEWEIHLTTNNEFKSKMDEANHLGWGIRRKTLMKGLPRYIWRAKAKSAGEDVIDLLFDATDIEQSTLLVHAVPYDRDLFEILRRRSKNPESVRNIKVKSIWKALDWFSKQ